MPTPLYTWEFWVGENRDECHELSSLSQLPSSVSTYDYCRRFEEGESAYEVSSVRCCCRFGPVRLPLPGRRLDSRHGQAPRMSKTPTGRLCCTAAHHRDGQIQFVSNLSFLLWEVRPGSTVANTGFASLSLVTAKAPHRPIGKDHGNWTKNDGSIEIQATQLGML